MSKNKKELLEKAKKMRLGRLSLLFENPWEIIWNAAEKTVLFGKPQGIQEISEAIKDITIEDIEKTVDKFLKPESFTTVLLMPKDAK